MPNNKSDWRLILDQKTKAIYEARADIFKAMAHPARLLIVDELSHGEKCVAELTDMIGSDMSTVSKHLSILKNAGIIKDERRGSHIYYTLWMKCVLDFFSCVERVIQITAKEKMSLSRK